MNLFCIDEKELCCPLCHFYNAHEGHKVLSIEDEEDLKQYYIEYNQGDTTYKMWIEDQESISAKLDLVNKYNLAGAGFWEKDRENNMLVL